MRDIHRYGLATQGFGLGPGGIAELAGGDKYAGDAAAFQICDVVHTARRAGASICQGFDHRVAIGADFLLELKRGYSGKRRFLIPFDRQPLLIELFFNAIQKKIPAGLGDIQ